MRQPTPREFYRILHRIADGKVARLEAAFLRAITVTASQVDRDALTAALARGDVQAAFDAVGLNGQLEARLRDALATTLRTAYVQAGVATAAAMPPFPDPTVSLRFDLTNPRAVQWARGHSSARVKQITNETKGIIRDAIANGFEAQVTYRVTGRTIRETLLAAKPRTLGLTRRQYRAVVRERARLEAEGVDADTVTRRIDRYAAKLLRQRGLTIARTETIAASAAGQDEAWHQAVDEGLLDTDMMRRNWLVTPDDRLCPICEAIPGLNPQGVGLDEPFATPDGPVQMPPVHPRCRCAVVLDVDYAGVPVARAAA